MAGSGADESDVHGAVGSYVVHGLSPEERLAFERHLAGCSACQVEVRELVETVAELSRLTSQAPPAGLGPRVLGGVRRLRPLPPAPAALHRPQRHAPPEATPTPVGSPRPSRLRVLALALVVAFVLGGAGLGLAHRDQHQVQAVEAAQQDRLMTAADVTVHRSVLSGGHPVTLVVSQHQDCALLVGAALPPLDRGLAYQLWTQDGAGTLTPGPAFGSRGRDRVWLGTHVTDAVAVALSVEPDGGSTRPSSGTQVIAAF